MRCGAIAEAFLAGDPVELQGHRGDVVLLVEGQRQVGIADLVAHGPGFASEIGRIAIPVPRAVRAVGTVLMPGAARVPFVEEMLAREIDVLDAPARRSGRAASHRRAPLRRTPPGR